ncbi:hypothetical protein Y88_3466 [Novosphingobium nitrogenifigens DSM 19370]|uniref:Uncharacterized protein n=1 Tax=Novosphingobium nitrogenifigens DSM 19370 TaxID=983920 RepID=F1Z352_9SPHN|nr:hypothetical protein Y88_3466 [Novosphingobium nitrogenifigens DSM 19370]
MRVHCTLFPKSVAHTKKPPQRIPFGTCPGGAIATRCVESGSEIVPVHHWTIPKPCFMRISDSPRSPQVFLYE